MRKSAEAVDRVMHPSGVLPGYFTTVTPFSKILAAVLFIVLPFLGFYLGMKYQQIPEVPQVAETKASNWKTYRNQLYGFSFSYPSTNNLRITPRPGRSLNLELTGDTAGYCLQNPSDTCTKLFEVRKNLPLLTMYVTKGTISVTESLTGLKADVTPGHQINTGVFRGDYVCEGLFYSDVTVNSFYDTYHWVYPDAAKDYSYTFETGNPVNSNSDIYRIIKSLKFFDGRTGISRSSKSSTFSTCHDMVYFKDYPWYQAFTDLLHNSDLATDTFTQACLSEDESVLVLVREGAYCLGPLISQYSITENKYDEASVIAPSGCLSGSDKFEKIHQTGFDLKGWGGDAGCGSEDYFTYDPSTNIVKLTKSYSGCEGDAGYKWTYY